MMFGSERSLHKFCLVCALTAVFFLQGCRRKEPASDSSANDKTTEPVTQRAQYANDLDRLDQLVGRINGVCRSSYVVVLGADDSAAGSGPVSVDYALFDRLSDDGAAVLIAEAIAAKVELPLQMQVRPNVARVILQTDETVGRRIAMAGFGSAGFTEWLKAKGLPPAGLQQRGVPEKSRIAAFMRGYLSAGAKKGI